MWWQADALDRHMLQTDPADRTDATAVLAHPWVAAAPHAVDATIRADMQRRYDDILEQKEEERLEARRAAGALRYVRMLREQCLWCRR